MRTRSSFSLPLWAFRALLGSIVVLTTAYAVLTVGHFIAERHAVSGWMVVQIGSALFILAVNAGTLHWLWNAPATPPRPLRIAAVFMAVLAAGGGIHIALLASRMGDAEYGVLVAMGLLLVQALLILLPPASGSAATHLPA